jgi:hypothetical protein
MTMKTEKRPAVGLQRVVTSDGGVVVNRPYRRPISGVAYHAQKCRLVLDMPDAAGNESYPCKIANVSDCGFGVVCRAAETTPDVFQPGAHMTLEAWDGKRSRVEIRWINKARLGLKRAPHKTAR